jgi:hypothetical protein
MAATADVLKLDRLEVQVLMDNATDSLSTTPKRYLI